jgi:hypothetical protein
VGAVVTLPTSVLRLVAAGGDPASHATGKIASAAVMRERMTAIDERERRSF